MKLFSKTGLRKVLIVAQFTLSLVFIISTILVYQQLDFMLHADYGFNKENIINVPINNTDHQLLKSELDKYSSIQNVAIASHIAAAGETHGTDFKTNLADEGIELSYFSVDNDYVENLGLSIIAGRNFSESATSPEQHIILNEAAIANVGLSSPQEAIGETVYIDDSLALEIIGVVADYNHQTLVSEIGSMALRYNPERFSHLQVRHSEGNYDQALLDIQVAWAKVNPGLKMDHSKFEDDLTMFYDLMFGDLVNIVGVFAFIAITVACLGLLGMATFTTETRMKEVSIRKVLGAEDKNVIMLLSKGFLIMLSIAIVLAVPMSYMLNSLWLDAIAYRIDISPLTLAMSTLIILGLGALTIGSQTYKAATVNPAESLKME